MPSHRSSLAIAFLAALTACPFAGCYRLRTTTTASDSLPTALEGEWRGEWANANGGAAGTVVLLVRSFQGEFVLGIDTDFPAASQQTISYVIRGTHIEVGGTDVAFAGDIDGHTRAITGTFTSLEGGGTWNADWVRTLPAIVDLTGSWVGSFATASQPVETGPINLHLEQWLDGGQLRVMGELELVDTGLRVPLVHGVIAWGADDFSVQLVSDTTTLPVVQLSGVGTPSGPRIEQGDFVVLPPPGTPSVFGTWQADWVTR